MNRQLGGKQSGEASDPLSLLVNAADSQRPSAKGGSHGKPGDHGGRDDHGGRGPVASLEEQMAQRQAAFRAEALHHQGILSQLRGGALGGDASDFFQHNAGLVAAQQQQQQQQAAALALASDIRTAVAAAQLRQAAQFQNHDFLLARTAALQQLGALGGGGFEQLQQELEFHKLEEMERRQLLAAAAGGAPMAALAARQQELQEAHMRQEQLDRQLGVGGAESMMERVRAQSEERSNRAALGDGGVKDSFQKTPGSVVVPCRARGMPMDHNFKTAYFVIPENVEHGEELICSYFACRNAGIKFRYCTHCKVPVAKRNFRKRHKHGKSSSGNDGDDYEDVDDEEEIPKATKKAAEPEPKKEVSAPSCHVIQKKAELPVHVPSVKKSKTPKESRPASNEKPEAVPPPVPDQARPKICAEREGLWAQLLAKRPPTKDGEAVSAWLMEVLSVSDLDTPLKENGQVSPNAVSSLPFKTGAGAPGVAAQLAAASKNWSKNGAGKEADPAHPSGAAKKKRPLSALMDEDSEETDDDSDEPPAKEDGPPKKGVGSFAEWKDRKKHKSLPKKGFSSLSE